jgi:hypothetical protein
MKSKADTDSFNDVSHNTMKHSVYVLFGDCGFELKNSYGVIQIER